MSRNRLKKRPEKIEITDCYGLLNFSESVFNLAPPVAAAGVFSGGPGPPDDFFPRELFSFCREDLC